MADEWVGIYHDEANKIGCLFHRIIQKKWDNYEDLLGFCKIDIYWEDDLQLIEKE